MPLQQKRLQSLIAYRALPPAIGQNDRIPHFEAEGVPFRGSLQPMDSPADRQVYGVQAARLLRLITAEGAFLTLGMGIGLENQGCQYRICQPVSRWQGHSVAVLERLE